MGILPGVWGNRGIKVFIPGEQREQRSTNEGNMGTKAILGNRELGNVDFDFGEPGNKATYFRGTREQVPSGWPHVCLDN